MICRRQFEKVFDLILKIHIYPTSSQLVTVTRQKNIKHQKEHKKLGSIHRHIIYFIRLICSLLTRL